MPLGCRLGTIRLRDFKNLFEDCERYRYYFKALDAEYGTVKEEVKKKILECKYATFNI
jgi:hypothetical protein